MKINIPNVENIKSTVGKITNGKLKAEDLVRQHLELAHQINKDLNAFITILDSAIEDAKEIDRKIANGEDVGELAGIPFTVKDLYLVKNTKTTSSSRLMEDFVAPYTATVVQKCMDEGAILIGKCNSDPWGFGGSGENSGFGPTKNPYDLTRTPGGSSSGSAASLASGVGFFSLGTDTGGSVRLPASFCGLYGLKPTYGSNSRYGISPMGSSFDTPGFFARHLEDIELLQKIMKGRDINDATTYDQELVNTKRIEKPVIGILKEFLTEDVDIDIRDAIFDKIDSYKSKGFVIKEISMPVLKYGLAVYYVLVPSEISSNRAKYDGVRFGKKVSDNYTENLIESRSKFMEDEVKRRIMIGTYCLSAGYGDKFYLKASLVRTKIKQEFDKVFEDVDILIGAVSPTPAFKLGEKSADPVQMYLVDVFTVTANLAGIPALSVPLGLNSNGLPIGMQIMARKFEEETIFGLVESNSL